MKVIKGVWFLLSRMVVTFICGPFMFFFLVMLFPVDMCVDEVNLLTSFITSSISCLVGVFVGVFTSRKLCRFYKDISLKTVSKKKLCSLCLIFVLIISIFTACFFEKFDVGIFYMTNILISSTLGFVLSFRRL